MWLWGKGYVLREKGNLVEEKGNVFGRECGGRGRVRSNVISSVTQNTSEGEGKVV